MSCPAAASLIILFDCSLAFVCDHWWQLILLMQPYLKVFGLRSWTSLRIMSIEQRTELLKRIGAGGPETRKSAFECAKIAKDLNLSLEQVGLVAWRLIYWSQIIFFSFRDMPTDRLCFGPPNAGSSCFV